MIVFLGIGRHDTPAVAERLAEKVARLRIFRDQEGLMNLPREDREVLCISQFTLYGDVSRGNRPSFIGAADPAVAEQLYDCFCSKINAQRGAFGNEMVIHVVHDGPVTLLIEI